MKRYEYRLSCLYIKAQCSDCYKCIRECPVKAIKIEAGHASVISQLNVWLVGIVLLFYFLKKLKIRSDSDKIKGLIKAKKVYIHWRLVGKELLVVQTLFN